jgi:hypothetical protein
MFNIVGNTTSGTIKPLRKNTGTEQDQDLYALGMNGAMNVPAYMMTNMVYESGMVGGSQQAPGSDEPDLVLLETFSKSENDQGPNFIAKAEGSITKKTVDFNKGNVKTAYFNNKSKYPVLFNINKVLYSLSPKTGTAINDVAPKDLLTNFQTNCNRFNIYAKIYETNSYEPVKIDSVLGRQTVRAMVFVYELGQLEVAFGFVNNFDEYVAMFNSGDQAYLDNVLEFKKFINGNEKIKQALFKSGEEISDLDEASIKGNTGEAIIGLYAQFKAGMVGKSDLKNISDGTKIMIRQAIKPEDTGKVKNLPAVIEAKKILYCMRDIDGNRINKDLQLDGSWNSGDAFDVALSNIAPGGVIDSNAAKILIGKCADEMNKIENILNLNDSNKILSTVSTAVRKGLLKTFNEIKGNSNLSEADKLVLMDKDVVEKYMVQLSGVDENKAKMKLGLAREVYNKVMLLPQDDQSSVFQGKVNENVLNGIDQAIKDGKYTEAFNNAKQAVNDGYNEYVRLMAKAYTDKFNELASQVEAIKADQKGAQEVLDGMRDQITASLSAVKDKYVLVVGEGEGNGAIIGTPPKLSGDYMLDLNAILKKKSDDIRLFMEAGPILQDIEAMRQKINEAVETDVNDKSKNDRAEFEGIRQKLEYIGSQPKDVEKLSEKYTAIGIAGAKIYDVLMTKLETCKDKPYYQMLKDKFDEHIKYFKEQLDAKINSLGGGKLPINVGMWNPPAELNRTTTFGLTPILSGNDVTRVRKNDQGRYIIIPNQGNGGTLGFGYDFWPLIAKDNPDKGTFGMNVQNRTGKNSISKDFSLAVNFDPGMCKLGAFEGDLKDIFGVLKVRPTFYFNYGHNGEFKTNRLEASGSLAVGLSDPLHIKDFALIKYFGLTLAYSGQSALGGNDIMDVADGSYNNYWEAANRNIYLKTEILLAPRTQSGFFDYANLYLKNNLGNDPYNPYVSSREKYRFGGIFGFGKGRGTLGVEGYNSPSYYTGDPTAKKMDLDAVLKYSIVNWDNKKSGEEKKSVVVTLNAFSTGIVGWINRGYNMAPIGVGVSVHVTLPHNIKINGSYEGVIRNRKVKSGPVDKVIPGQQTRTALWDGISIDVAGGPYQTTNTITLDVNDRTYASMDPNYKPKIIIDASSVNYMKRGLISGAIGDAALTAWEDGGSAPVKLYIKSVKLIDRAHNNQIYGLDASGNWVPLTGDQPVPAPELLMNGTREFTLPEALWQSTTGDGRINVYAVVEYGADVSSIPDKNALKKYTSGNNRVLVWDPDEGVMAVYNNRVWWEGHNDNDTNNKIYVDSYDPTQPYDPNSNIYYVGVRKLAPISLGTTLKY